MSKPRIGITIGDINGIGPELIIRTLKDKKISSRFIPIIYGSSKVISYYRNIIGAQDFHPAYYDSKGHVKEGNIYIKNCWDDKANITVGEATEEGGRLAALAMKHAVEDAQNGLLDGIVTAPINKEAMKKSGFEFPGHTEYFAERFNAKETVMMMVSMGLRVALVTNHIPVSQIIEKLTREKIISKLVILDQSLRKDFGIEKPKIAVLGLNPHAGDNGTIGTEDVELIKPIIVDAKNNGMHVSGPYPPDGFFGSSQFKKFDAVLAMYHDQGLIPFKALTFGNGVNFTAGLPIVRTSPDHGTAYDIAGQNTVEISSFRAAIFEAIDIVNMRKELKEMTREKKERKERTEKKEKSQSKSN